MRTLGNGTKKRKRGTKMNVEKLFETYFDERESA